MARPRSRDNCSIGAKASVAWKRFSLISRLPQRQSSFALVGGPPERLLAKRRFSLDRPRSPACGTTRAVRFSKRPSLPGPSRPSATVGALPRRPRCAAHVACRRWARANWRRPDDIRSIPSPPPPPPPRPALRPRLPAAPVVRAHVFVGGFAGPRRRQVGGAAERALAGIGAARRLDVGLTRQRIVADREGDRLQPLDLVAQARRLLEFEIAGRLLHPLLHVGDGRLKVLADRRAVGEADVHRDVVGLVDGAQNVLDAAPDRG